MATVAHPGPGPEGSSRQLKVEQSVENFMTRFSKESILAAVVLFGLLLLFIAQLVRIGGSAAGVGGNAHSAYQILAAIGSYLMVAVLFIGGIMKRNENEFIRFGLLIAAGLVFVAAAFLI